MKLVETVDLAELEEMAKNMYGDLVKAVDDDATRNLILEIVGEIVNG